MVFAAKNGALFELIFHNFEIFAPDEDLEVAGQEAYGVLRNVCAPFTGPGHPPAIVETQVWSLIHGYAMPRLAGKFSPYGPGGPGSNAYDEVMALLDRVGVEP